MHFQEPYCSPPLVWQLDRQSIGRESAESTLKELRSAKLDPDLISTGMTVTLSLQGTLIVTIIRVVQSQV